MNFYNPKHMCTWRSYDHCMQLQSMTKVPQDLERGLRTAHLATLLGSPTHNSVVQAIRWQLAGVKGEKRTPPRSTPISAAPAGISF